MPAKRSTAKRRASTAIRLIKNGNVYERNFDDCFEMGDGNEVMDHIIEKAKTDLVLAKAIKEYVPKLGTEEKNRRLCEAIDECENGTEYNLFTFSD